MIRVLFIFAMVAGTVGPCLAQPRRDEMKVCTADYRRFCTDTAPGGGRILQCLKEHAQELSPACRALVERQGG